MITLYVGSVLKVKEISIDEGSAYESVEMLYEHQISQTVVNLPFVHRTTRAKNRRHISLAFCIHKLFPGHGEVDH